MGVKKMNWEGRRGGILAGELKQFLFFPMSNYCGWGLLGVQYRCGGFAVVFRVLIGARCVVCS